MSVWKPPSLQTNWRFSAWTILSAFNQGGWSKVAHGAWALNFFACDITKSNVWIYAWLVGRIEIIYRQIEIIFVGVVLFRIVRIDTILDEFLSVDDKNQLLWHRRSYVDIVIPRSQLSDFAVIADLRSNRNFLICADCWYGKISIPQLSAKAAAGRRFFNIGTFPNDPACFLLK